MGIKAASLCCYTSIGTEFEKLTRYTLKTLLVVYLSAWHICYMRPTYCLPAAMQPQNGTL